MRTATSAPPTSWRSRWRRCRRASPASASTPASASWPVLRRDAAGAGRRAVVGRAARRRHLRGDAARAGGALPGSRARRVPDRGRFGAMAKEDCRRAVEEFRAEHGIDDPIETVDWTCVLRAATSRTRGCAAPTGSSACGPHPTRRAARRPAGADRTRARARARARCCASGRRRRVRGGGVAAGRPAMIAFGPRSPVPRSSGLRGARASGAPRSRTPRCSTLDPAGRSSGATTRSSTAPPRSTTSRRSCSSTRTPSCRPRPLRDRAAHARRSRTSAWSAASAPSACARIAWWEGSVTLASFVNRYDEHGGGDLPAFSWAGRRAALRADRRGGDARRLRARALAVGGARAALRQGARRASTATTSTSASRSGRRAARSSPPTSARCTTARWRCSPTPTSGRGARPRRREVGRPDAGSAARPGLARARAARRGRARRRARGRATGRRSRADVRARELERALDEASGSTRGGSPRRCGCSRAPAAPRVIAFGDRDRRPRGLPRATRAPGSTRAAEPDSVVLPSRPGRSPAASTSLLERPPRLRRPRGARARPRVRRARRPGHLRDGPRGARRPGGRRRGLRRGGGRAQRSPGGRARSARPGRPPLQRARRRRARRRSPGPPRPRAGGGRGARRLPARALAVGGARAALRRGAARSASGYDVDFCRQVRAAGRKVVTADLPRDPPPPARAGRATSSCGSRPRRASRRSGTPLPEEGDWKARARRAEAEREAARAMAYSNASPLDARVRRSSASSRPDRAARRGG